MNANTSTRLISDDFAMSTKRFSPPAEAPERSSASSHSTFEPSRAVAVNALPSAWTTPLEPSVNSYSAARSRSIAPDDPPPSTFERNPPEDGAPSGRAVQLRLTRIWPPDEPCLVSESVGVDLVRVTLDGDPSAPAAGFGFFV